MSQSARKETTRRLSELTEKYINPNNDPRIYWAKEVTFDYSEEKPIRVDYMKFAPENNSVSGIEKGNVYCYEVKSCPEDFHSKNGHNMIGDYNYYVMPQETYNMVHQEIPWGIGVLVEENGDLIVAKRTHRRNRSRPIMEVLLMMFRSACREKRKPLPEVESYWERWDDTDAWTCRHCGHEVCGYEEDPAKYGAIRCENCGAVMKPGVTENEMHRDMG